MGQGARSLEPLCTDWTLWRVPPCPTRLGEMPGQSACELARINRLLVSRHLGISGGHHPSIIAGGEDERYAARPQRLSHRINQLAIEVDVEHCAVELGLAV